VSLNLGFITAASFQRRCDCNSRLYISKSFQVQSLSCSAAV